MKKTGNCEKSVRYIVKDTYAAKGDELTSLLEKIIIQQIVKDMQE